MTETLNPPVKTSGFIDAHSHLRSTTLEDQLVAGSSSLEEALLRMTAMSSVALEDDTLVACSELIAAGVTGVQFIFHVFDKPEAYLEALSRAVEGIEKSGIHALVILGITDQAEFLPIGVNDNSLLPPWLPPAVNLTHAEFAEVYSEAKKMFPQLNLGLGPIGGQWCSNRLLGLIRELSEDGARIHSHLLESRLQRRWAGDSPLERLAEANLLGPKTSLAHGVWCDAEDLARVRDSGAQLVTCPGSNSMLGSGRADLALWQETEVKFGFGLDSAAANPRPLQIAQSAMPRDVAIRALTIGGKDCTDLPADLDSVEWQDFDSGVVDKVTIGGKTLFEKGRLHNQTAVDSAKARIAEAMQRDAENRANRNRVIDSRLGNYLAAVGKCCA